MVEEIILDAEQLRCLSSPPCNQMLHTLRTLERASASEAAKAIGKSPATAHHHLKTLQSHGLVEEALRRPTARKPEVVYQLAARGC